MVVSETKKREYIRRIMLSRMRLLCDNGFYGLLLMHTRMNLGDEHETVWSEDGDRIFLNPDFLERISDRELDYALMHVLLHIVLNHVGRKGNFEEQYFDRAADIVVNSNILRSNGGDLSFLTLRNFGDVQPHLAPDGEEGWKYTLEEVYSMLKAQVKAKEKEGGSWDYHSRNEADTLEGESTKKLKTQEWQTYVLQAAEAVGNRNAEKERGLIPAFVERYLDELKKPQTDWRTILDEFIQEEINDYSFCPPDRRFEESPFFLPDFNEKDYRVEKILFMIDTSGSMSDDEITQCYTEIKGAIDQFNGKLEGWLGFFDAAVTEPEPFADEEEFRAIRPKGGGGTSFQVIFDYVREFMQDSLPVSIVILTDGYAPFPEKREAMDIPVLWLIDNEKVTPPWGKIARVQIS